MFKKKPLKKAAPAKKVAAKPAKKAAPLKKAAAAKLPAAKPVAAKVQAAKKAAAPKGKAAAPVKAAPVKAAPVKATPAKAMPPAKAAKGKAAVAPAPVPAKAEKLAKSKLIPPQKAGKEAKVKAPVEIEPEVAELEAEDAEEIIEDEEIVLTDAEGRRYCRVKDCDQLAAVDTYCRYHYLLFWKKIQVRKKILSEGKLERYIEELTARYPDKFLDMLRKDLKSEKEFLAAIQELEIDESAVDNEFEDEAQTYIDEVRGMGEPAAREEEDF